MSADLDALVQRLEAALCAERRTLESATPTGFLAIAERLKPEGHRIELRTACWWTADALTAAAEGRADEALRWAEKATYELNRAVGVHAGGVE